MMKVNLLTKLKLSDQETTTANDIHNIYSSFVGNILVVLSGALLYIDKAFAYLGWKVKLFSQYENMGYDQETFLWLITASICPILLIISVWMKAKAISYVVPLYAYTLQLYFVFFDLKIIDKSYIYWYAGGVTLLIVLAFRVIRNIAIRNIKKEIKKTKEELLKNQ